MGSSMEGSFLPPGFRFHPNDVELLEFYLKRKIMGIPFEFEAISELDLYKFPPWDLPQKSHFKSIDLEWYFFCPRSRKHGSGSRMNRANDVGYWKVSGRDRIILRNNQLLGMKKILVFYVGKAPRGERTNWVMHEYRLGNKDLCGGLELDGYVLCRVFQKGGQNESQSREEEDLATGDDMVNYDGSSDLIPPLLEEKAKALPKESIFSNQVEDLSNLDKTRVEPVAYPNDSELYKDLDDLGFYSDLNNQGFWLPEDGFMTGNYDNNINLEGSYDPVLNNGFLLPGLDAIPEENTAKGETTIPDDQYNAEAYPKDNIGWGGNYMGDLPSANSLSSTSWEASKPNGEAKTTLSSLIFQSFWDSIPARAASAVEYPIPTCYNKSVTSRPKTRFPRKMDSCARPSQHGGRFGPLLGLAFLALLIWFALLLVFVKFGMFVWKLIMA